MGIEVVFCDVQLRNKKIRGAIRPNTVTGVVSVTEDSGGSDLLKAIAGKGQVGGIVMAGGHAATSRVMKRRIALTGGTFCDHDDINAALTVRDNILYKLELYTSLAKIDRVSECIELLHKLGLDTEADSVVKDLPLSVRQRLYIALALCVKPDLLVMLDPVDNQRLDHSIEFVTLLKEQSHGGGPTVLLSMSNLRLGIFQLCDDIVVLDRGEIAYMGAREQVLPYFAGLGFELEGTSACDMLMDMLMQEHALGGAQSALAHAYRASEAAKKIEVIISKHMKVNVAAASMHVEDVIGVGGNPVDLHHVKPNVFWIFVAISRYSIKEVQRKWYVYLAWLFLGVCLSMLLIKVVGNSLSNDAVSIQNRRGILFITLITFYYLNFVNMDVYRMSPVQERHGTSIAAINFIVVAFQRFLTTLIATISIGPIVFYVGQTAFSPSDRNGLPLTSGGDFRDFIVPISITSFAHSCLLYFFGALPISHKQFAFLVNAALLYDIVASGYWFNIATMPPGMATISLLRYGYEAVLINQLANVTTTAACNNVTRVNLLESLGYGDDAVMLGGTVVQSCVNTLSLVSGILLVLSLCVIVVRGKLRKRNAVVTIE